jgi:molybdopterin/thiamine biosynthesis adenylyltransferase
MKYYLKRYLSAFTTLDKIKVGVYPEYIETPDTAEYRTIIEKLVTVGVDIGEINDVSLYSDMYQKGMLSTNNSRQRKQMYLDMLNVEFPEEKLSTKILVLGAGGMGSTTSYLLAQFGFKDITVVDFDTIADSDVEKMMVYKKEHIGKLKIDVLKDVIESQFDYCSVKKINQKIHSKDELTFLIENTGTNFVIRAMDPKQIAFRFWLNEICFSLRIPFIMCSYAFEYLRLGPLCNPGMTSCDNCYNLWLIDNLGKEYDCSVQEKLFNHYSIHPSISFNINLASNLSLKEIIFFFVGKYEYVKTLGAIIDYQPLQLTGSASEIPHHPSCSICRI